jgi:Ricin-type beta-trefoil lectin domain
MRIFKKVATSMAAVGLLAFGAVAGSGGSALAAADQPITGCSASEGLLALGLVPNCTAGDSTILNPTSITITLNTTALAALINAVPGLGMKATWTLSCVVNGATATAPGSLTVTNTSQSASDVIDLQTAVGSPTPASCTVENLKATTTLALSIGALSLSPFVVGVNATADTTIPGAIYADYPNDAAGAHAVVCADDTGNGQSGTTVQGFQCLSDLADYWTQTPAGQFVHNGVCLTDAEGAAKIELCASNPNNSSGQLWTSAATGAGEVTNADGAGCLTAPSAGTISGASLMVAACTGARGQEWTVPGANT